MQTYDCEHGTTQFMTIMYIVWYPPQQAGQRQRGRGKGKEANGERREGAPAGRTPAERGLDPRSLGFELNTLGRMGMQGNGYILPRLRCTLRSHERYTQHSDEPPSRGYLCKGSGGFLQPPAHHLHCIVPSARWGSNPRRLVCKADALQLSYRDSLWTVALRIQTLQPQALPSAGTRHADL